MKETEEKTREESERDKGKSVRTGEIEGKERAEKIEREMTGMAEGKTKRGRHQEKDTGGGRGETMRYRSHRDKERTELGIPRGREE